MIQNLGKIHETIGNQRYKVLKFRKLSKQQKVYIYEQNSVIKTTKFCCKSITNQNRFAVNYKL